MSKLSYYDYLKELLAPLGIYDLESGAGALELQVLGGQMDQIFTALEELMREMLIPTAEGYGLQNYNRLLPGNASFLTPEDERRALAALCRIRHGCFTLEALGDTLAGCGIDATVREGEEPMTAVVSFPGYRGVPDEIRSIASRVEQILPAQLLVKYEYNFALWCELQSVFPLWSFVMDGGMTWKLMEAYLFEKGTGAGL